MKRGAPMRFHPIESKTMAIAAVIGFLTAVWWTEGSLYAGFGALALIAGIGWIAHLILR